jgi:putative ABC transport system permease protein
MTPFRLTIKSIARSPFRSTVVFLCALLVAGLAISTVLITRGAQDSLRLANERLGADILVVPEGAEQKVEGALLMGHQADVWMPAGNVAKVAAVPGVEAATPQLYLATLADASCCSVPNMLMVAYDPASDFTIRPWLEKTIGRDLKLGEVVGGTYVYTPEGLQNIELYGYLVTLKANLEPTGTNLDRSMFLTFETARDMARISTSRAEKPLVIPPDSISSVLVGVAPGQDPKKVAVDILKTVPGVRPITSPELFSSFRKQMTGLWQVMLAVLSLTLILSLILIGLIFAMSAHERRREIGVMRALGAKRATVLRSLLFEAWVLGLAGGLSGAALGAVAVYLFRNLIVDSVGFPFLYPEVPSLLALIAVGLFVVLMGVTLAAFVPSFRISRQDPAVAMRE